MAGGRWEYGTAASTAATPRWSSTAKMWRRLAYVIVAGTAWRVHPALRRWSSTGWSTGAAAGWTARGDLAAGRTHLRPYRRGGASELLQLASWPYPPRRASARRGRGRGRAGSSACLPGCGALAPPRGRTGRRCRPRPVRRGTPPAARRSRRTPGGLCRFGGSSLFAGPERRALHELRRNGPASLGAALADQRVAHRAQQIAELVVFAEQPRPREHARVGLLDEVLGLFARACPGPRCAVEARKVPHRTIGIEPARSAHQTREGIDARKASVPGERNAIEIRRSTR